MRRDGHGTMLRTRTVFYFPLYDYFIGSRAPTYTAARWKRSVQPCDAIYGIMNNNNNNNNNNGNSYLEGPKHQTATVMNFCAQVVKSSNIIYLKPVHRHHPVSNFLFHDRKTPQSLPLETLHIIFSSFNSTFLTFAPIFSDNALS